MRGRSRRKHQWNIFLLLLLDAIPDKIRPFHPIIILSRWWWSLLFLFKEKTKKVSCAGLSSALLQWRPHPLLLCVSGNRVKRNESPLYLSPQLGTE